MGLRSFAEGSARENVSLYWWKWAKISFSCYAEEGNTGSCVNSTIVWKVILVTTSLRSRKTQPFRTTKVPSQVGSLDLCSEFRVFPKENTPPEDEPSRSKGSNVLFLHPAKCHSQTKPVEIRFELDSSRQISFLQKLPKGLGFIL